jgi:hypothetical protein
VCINGTLVEAKKFTFTLESTHFIFKKCHIDTHDGASAKFSTNSQEKDYRVVMEFITADAIAYDGQLTVNSEHVVMSREKERGSFFCRCWLGAEGGWWGQMTFPQSNV